MPRTIPVAASININIKFIIQNVQYKLYDYL